MRTMHLIIDNNCRHTIYDSLGKSDFTMVSVIEHLKREADGYPGEIIICDENNMPVSYIPINGTRKRDFLNSRLSEAVMIVTAVVLFILFL